MLTRDAILDALLTFAAQRPGLEYGNYGDPTTYRAEMREITSRLHDVRELVAAVRWRFTIDAEALLSAARHSFSGRVSITERDGVCVVDYCTGQYFPTEYRRAVAVMLATALWQYWCDNSTATEKAQDIRRTARRELSRRVARRYFN